MNNGENNNLADTHYNTKQLEHQLLKSSGKIPSAKNRRYLNMGLLKQMYIKGKIEKVNT